ncbi:MAG: hypothetical protein KGJ80_17440, partial [Chloroflexota bacterium]|nr:hypothetical protein [Chloroflexota bacterium]
MNRSVARNILRGVIDDQLAAELARAALILHTGDETRAEVIDFDSETVQQLHVLRRELHEDETGFFLAARLPNM